MTTKDFVSVLTHQNFSAEEIFYVVAFFVHKDLSRITTGDLQHFVPLWKLAINRRNKILAEYKKTIYDSDVTDESFIPYL